VPLRNYTHSLTWCFANIEITDVKPTATPLPGQPPNESDAGSESDGEESYVSRPEQQGGGGGRVQDAERARVAHRKPCRRHEIRRVGCLNGGRCFVMELHDGFRRPGCR